MRFRSLGFYGFLVYLYHKAPLGWRLMDRNKNFIFFTYGRDVLFFFYVGALAENLLLLLRVR